MDLLPTLDPDLAQSAVAIFATNALWNEVKIFNRLIYKMHNQHRSAIYFKKLLGVQRCLEHLDFMEKWLEYQPVMERSTIEYLHRLQQTDLLSKETRRRMISVGREVRRLVKASFFLPLMTVILGCLARINILLEIFEQEDLGNFYAECVRKMSDRTQRLRDAGLPIPDLSSIKTRKPIAGSKRAVRDLDPGSLFEKPVDLKKKRKLAENEKKAVTAAGSKDEQTEDPIGAIFGSSTNSLKYPDLNLF